MFERSAACLTITALERFIVSDQAPIRLLVAETVGEAVGYAAVTFDWSVWRGRAYGHLDCLFVSDSARGKGVGAKLLQAAAGLVAKEGVDRLEWQTPTWNKGAVRFYIRAGAESMDKKRFTLTVSS